MSDLERVSAWLGRSVRRTDEDESVLGPALVLAVDDTPYAPSAWIKYVEAHPGRDYPTYRSVDLSDLEDIETTEGGPRWGTPAQVDTHPKGGDGVAGSVHG